ncbi:MAG TPA: hypothetical protein VEO00_02035 [Actinomycetota bacterium]|nr:hypothetical protein [Actinomycetota bacterium]
MPFALRVLIAFAIGGVILFVGYRFLRAIGAGAGQAHEEEPEDVGDLDVFFVCAECGTEYKVTRLGELTVPRHCGEPMEVVRRPVQHPELN